MLTFDVLDFSLITDIDSIRFSLNKNENHSFSVLKQGMQPLVIKVFNGLELKSLSFDLENHNENYRIVYQQDINDVYLQELRARYPIDSIAATADTDIEKVKKISTWVHGLWQHDGNNEPEKRDALYILEEVKKGRRFRCVEYGIVTTACLNALGINARTLSLRTEDVETRSVGAGHVLLEVYLNDLNKWIMVDPQFDVIPHLFGMPLNAVEFQQTITEEKSVDVWSNSGTLIDEYKPWIYPYLYFFSVKFDNREGVSADEVKKVNEKISLMLVPIGAKNPTVFQIKYPINNCIYTNSLLDFYANPQ